MIAAACDPATARIIVGRKSTNPTTSSPMISAIPAPSIRPSWINHTSRLVPRLPLKRR
jgi:hypothetical protein